MAQQQIQKLANITQEIAALKTKAQEIEAALATEMVSVFRECHAFSVDLNVLIGGMLEVIHKAKTDVSSKEVWQKVGAKFRKRHRQLFHKKEAVHDVT